MGKRAKREAATLEGTTVDDAPTTPPKAQKANQVAKAIEKKPKKARSSTESNSGDAIPDSMFDLLLSQSNF